MGIRKKKEVKNIIPRPTTKLGQQVQRYRRLILQGTVLAIDPSSGSEGSMPGYALFKAGHLVENGILRLPLGAELHVRLQALRKLMLDFPTPDVVIVENLPPFMTFNSKAVLSLHKSVGVVIACTDCQALVEVTPGSWHKLAPASYKKSDANDSFLMGMTVIYEACKQQGIECPNYESILERMSE